MFFISVVISLISSIILLKVFTNGVFKNKLQSKNYKGNKIPTAIGIVFPFGYVLAIFPFLISSNFNSINFLIKFSYLLWSFALLGLLDDFFGRENNKGLKGHLKAFALNKEITTGLLKALYGLVVPLVIITAFINVKSINLINILQISLSVLIIGLSANAMNALDLKPGRAGKIFIILCFLSLLYTNIWQAYHIIPIIIMTLLYLPGDLRGQYMMGDTGSNTLGALWGGYAAFFFSFEVKVILFIFLIIFHIIIEMVSLSRLIEKAPIISQLDDWGRR